MIVMSKKRYFKQFNPQILNISMQKIFFFSSIALLEKFCGGEKM